MRAKSLFLFILPLIIISGCKKDKNQKTVLDGTYSGKFIETIQNSPGSPNNVMLSLKAGNHTSPGSIGFITTGNGSFKINGQTITFVDMGAYPDNTDYNSTAVLSGLYNYTVKGDSLFLSKTNESNVVFTYKVKKQ